MELTLTAEDAAAAKRLLLQLFKDDDVEDGNSAAALYKLACGIFGVRRERRHFFPDELFGDPAWDMILCLYCAEERGEKLSITDVGHSVGLSQTTAVRWIGALTEAGMIERQQDEHDRRRSFLRLTAGASEKVTMWLSRAGSVLGDALERRA